MDDNLSLSDEIKERYRNTYRGVFYKRYILGLWAMAEGVIYDMFDNEKHVEDPNEFQTKLINSNRYVSSECHSFPAVEQRNRWRLVLY